MAAQGTAAAYFVISPNPTVNLPKDLYVHGLNALGGAIGMVFLKFGDTTHAVNIAATENALVDRYRTTNPTFSIRANPAVAPRINNRSLGKSLEDRILAGYEWVVVQGKTSEWHEVRLKTTTAANPAPFIAELVRLQKRFAADPGQPAIVNPQWNDYVTDAVAVLDLYCVKFGS